MLCECGCGDEAGLGSQGRLRRFLPYHHVRLPRKRWEDYPAPVRDQQTGCLRWQGPHHTGGYGLRGKKYAHREAYQRAFGDIPSGYQIDHVRERGCIWRDCVEPSHLEVVSQAENVRRQPNVIAQMQRQSCPAGHLYAGENLIIRRGKRECRRCTYERNAEARRRRRAARKK